MSSVLGGSVSTIKYLTTDEVAIRVKARPETVRSWRVKKRGPRWFRPAGTRRILYAEHDVEAWLQEQYDAHEDGAA